ncbi:MAG: adenylate/guanylate cyclase domain-containing protein [Chitinophagaceae bacterium]
MDTVSYTAQTPLQADSRYVTYRAGIAEDEKKSVLVKRIKTAFPSPQAIKRLEQEFAILKKSEHPGIIRADHLEQVDNSLAIVFDDIPGQNLQTLIRKGPCRLDYFFSLMFPVMEAVRILHSTRTIHKNINPSNILIHNVTGQPKLINFSLACALSREMQLPDIREVNDTDLAYISPEQTGRMNRSVDHRSDLYSLGAVFYALLTGRQPFSYDDPLEMIHAHIARQPKSPGEINPSLPVPLSRIVLKLLAKNAEDRYQSIGGLMNDMRFCRQRFAGSGTIEDFSLATADLNDQFTIPDKLYGREKELQLLEHYCAQTMRGVGNFVLIGGYSGIGKSRLVGEMKKMIYEANGQFISGKFDQFKKDVPLNSLLDALQDLVQQVMTQGDEELNQCKDRILNAVGANGRIITDIIPGAEQLIGSQPALQDIPPAEASNRFNWTISRFVESFASNDKPLCIFLDDLQWIDSASRQWIEGHFTSGNSRNFMLIGAYRDNEVNASHPLMLLLDRLENQSIPVNEIKLQPLNADDLTQLISDALGKATSSCIDIADIIYQKTHGNPFFTRQCLLTLAEENSIYFNQEEYAWKYDLDKVKQAAISDNVLELMSGQILKLPDEVQELLMQASCIGHRFNSALLAGISGQTESSITDNILVAVQKGFLLPKYSYDKDEVEEYVFLHDRVQQAANNLLDDKEKKRIRLQVGRNLLQNASIDEREENIYDIADHLNFASEMITDPLENLQASKINHAASLRARNAAAYEPSLHYISMAMQLPPSVTELSQEFKNSLNLQRAEAEHLCGNNAIAEEYFDKAIEGTANLIDKAKVYQRKIHYYNNLRKFHEAYQTGRTAVRSLGVNLPAQFVPPLLVKDLVTYRLLMGRKRIEDILSLKEMTDEQLRMAILLMATFARAAYQIKPQLCIAVCTRMVNLCLKNGNTDGGFVGFLAFGPIFLGAILNRKQAGYDYGQLTLQLVEKYKSQQYRAETHFVVGYFAMPWRKPAKEMEAYWQIAYESGLESGDFFHASCACCGTIQSLYMRGVPFEEILQTADRYKEFLQRIGNTEGLYTLQGIQQVIRNLKGETQSPASLETDDFNEENYVQALNEFNSRHFAHYYYINKMQVLYLRGLHEEAYKIALQSDGYLSDSPGMLHTAEHFLFKSLIICALYNSGSLRQRQKWNRYLTKTLSRFTQWTNGCPENFLAKKELLKAEIERARGNVNDAHDRYANAIEAANAHGYPNILALANSRAADLNFKEGKRRLAGFYLQDAVHIYESMGATGYAKQLSQQYAIISENAFLQSKETTSFDLSTILKSSEAISKEIRLKDLLGSLLKITIENAGAQRMVLLLLKEKKWVVQAECTTADEEVTILPQIPLEQYKTIPRTVINYAAHAMKPLVLNDASTKGDFTQDEYFRSQSIRAVLCSPLIRQGQLTGIIYLENNLAASAFTQDRVDLLVLLSGQMAISIENALLYENLEDKVRERTQQLNEEKNKSESLLLNILPAETAEELKATGTAKAKEFAQVTVLFTDFKNFTSLSEQLNAQELVSEINYCYSAFDAIVSKYGVEKIKTIGDSYMCAGGIPVEKSSNPLDTLRAALEIRDFMLEEKQKREAAGKSFFDIRIGLHSGPVVAGIVGTRKFAYDIWGDTVNIASRMESSGEPGRINISGTTYELVKNDFECTFRGKVQAKNKGMIDMYFVESLKS